MAFTSAISGKTVMGNKRCHWGTYDGSGVTTGDINTGLSVCDFIDLTAQGAAIVADSPTLNETLPVAGSAVTIIFTSGSAGIWRAYGV